MNPCFGYFIAGDSVVHRLDPRIKILSLIALSVVILQAGSTAKLAAATAALACLVFLSGIRLRHVVGALRPVWVIALCFFLLHLFFSEGTPLVPGAPFVTREGLLKGIVVSWQFVALVWSGALLTMTTDPSELIGGLERLLRPLNRVGIPSHDVAVMVSIALRFVPTLFEEIRRMREAQIARGADFGSGTPTARLRKAYRLVIPLLLSAFRRADELALAMEGRGYRRGPRTYLKELRMGASDYAGAAVMLVFVAGLCLFPA